jgi:hypothetical protein
MDIRLVRFDETTLINLDHVKRIALMPEKVTLFFAGEPDTSARSYPIADLATTAREALGIKAESGKAFGGTR